MSGVIRIATRGSQQATTQAQHLAMQIEAQGHRCELVIVDTTGDRSQSANVPLHSIGGLGVFTKEVQHAVLDGRADIAAHSAKDLPTERPVDLEIGAVLARRNPADALIGRTFDDLGVGAIVATGSVRRRAQLREHRSDLVFEELRGNIGSRLEKIPNNGAIVMAIAALEILDLTDRVAERLDPRIFVPAVGQGAVAAECRIDDLTTLSILRKVSDITTYDNVSIERAYLAELGSGCSAPVGAFAADGRLTVFLGGDSGNYRATYDLTGVRDADLALAAQAARTARREIGV